MENSRAALESKAVDATVPTTPKPDADAEDRAALARRNAELEAQLRAVRAGSDTGARPGADTAARLDGIEARLSKMEDLLKRIAIKLGVAQ